MTKIEILKKFEVLLAKECRKLDKKELQLFSNFIRVNESPDDRLEEIDIKNREEWRKFLLVDSELREKYYLYHLNYTLIAKWSNFALEDVVNQIYENSESVKTLYEAAKSGK